MELQPQLRARDMHPVLGRTLMGLCGCSVGTVMRDGPTQVRREKKNSSSSSAFAKMFVQKKVTSMICGNTKLEATRGLGLRARTR
jgi:hypothetical protein